MIQKENLNKEKEAQKNNSRQRIRKKMYNHLNKQ